jgi:DNA (cytosine-5)-methyltransferase 1
MAAYYNEHDAFAAAWLRNLMQAGLIPEGDVDERSILDVRADDLRAYRQCHFFAGIGGWSHALRLAGWSDDREIWTGSCPCQPFSVAGKGKGKSDERHLWPVFFELIRNVRPSVVMGEQVAGKAGYDWFDGVATDLEREGYSARAADIPACSVGAPHIRQRIYWVAANMADANSQSIRGRLSAKAAGAPGDDEGEAQQREWFRSDVSTSRSGDDVADTITYGWDESLQSLPRGQAEWSRSDCINGSMGDANVSRPQEHRGFDELHQRTGWQGTIRPAFNSDLGDRKSNCSFWEGAEWIAGPDGKSRRVEPSIPLLANGIPNRVGRLRGYGNAIVPPLAAEVIKAFMEVAP